MIKVYTEFKRVTTDKTFYHNIIMIREKKFIKQNDNKFKFY